MLSLILAKLSKFRVLSRRFYYQSEADAWRSARDLAQARARLLR